MPTEYVCDNCGKVIEEGEEYSFEFINGRNHFYHDECPEEKVKCPCCGEEFVP